MGCKYNELFQFDHQFHEKEGDYQSFDFLVTLIFVELGGLEPPSKHRTEKLSTRLFFLHFSICACRKTGQRKLIL